MNIITLQAPYSKLNNLLYVSYIPKVINAAIEIGLFEILALKGFSLNEITEKLGISNTVTKALLNVLEKIELVTKANGTYRLTMLAKEYLLKNSQVNQLHGVKQFSGSNGPFSYLLQALKGEVPEFDDKMWSSKEASINMEQGIKAGGLQSVLSFVKSIPDFDSCTNMCDFAGNVGYFSYAFLQENSKLNAHVYDLPEVCQNAKELKCNEKDFNRVTYHAFDMKKGDSFGEGYDLFFISHYLYEFGANGVLVDFLKKVNKAMKLGGVFVSNHISDQFINKESELTLTLIELQTRIFGYPTHQLPEDTLKAALSEAGFGEFRIKQPGGDYAFSTLLLSVKKIKEIN